MNFVDKVTLEIKAGDGGNGRVNFRHEKFVDRGGPDGGDGGNGGDIVLIASRNQNTLARFRYLKELKAENGQAGDKQKKHGKSAAPLEVLVPVGTLATNEQGNIIGDLTEDGQQSIIAKGGRGGFGNAHFVSSTRQAPAFAENGELGEVVTLTLELKMIADVGLIGLPNAGKSTLLSRISNARPEIANYPFTTLIPNLGVVDIDSNSSLLFADIPGLIEGASEGKGLGHEFLRHIERTSVIIHLVDAYSDNIEKAYSTIREELKEHDPRLAKKPEVVALTKIEGLDKDIVDDQLTKLKSVVPRGTQLMAISSQAGTGLKELLFEVNKLVQVELQLRAKRKRPAEPVKPTHKLTDLSNQWKIVKNNDEFIVTGPKIEKFASRTDFNNTEAVQRLRDIMRKMGIMHELVRRGIEAEQVIRIGKNKLVY